MKSSLFPSKLNVILNYNVNYNVIQMDYVLVNAHVLATPVLTDINNDAYVEELVIPVSYYYDVIEYGLVQPHWSSITTKVKYMLKGQVHTPGVHFLTS